MVVHFLFQNVHAAHFKYQSLSVHDVIDDQAGPQNETD
jgi:hypothetical protein